MNTSQPIGFSPRDRLALRRQDLRNALEFGSEQDVAEARLALRRAAREVARQRRGAR